VTAFECRVDGYSGPMRAFALLSTTLIAMPVAMPAQVDFEREIAPILAAKCLPCHGPEKQKSGYRLDVRTVALVRCWIDEGAAWPETASRQVAHPLA